MFSRTGLVALTIAAATSRAMSAEATIGGVSIKLPTPSGFCELTDREPSDKRMIAFTADNLAKGGSKLIGMFADCGQLDDWRAGKRKVLDDVAQYQTPFIATIKPVSAEQIKELCVLMRAEGDKLGKDLKTRFEQTLARIKLNDANFIGAIAEEPNVCYAAMILKMSIDSVDEKTQAVIYATMSVRNKLVYIYRFAPYLGFESVSKGLLELKADVAALLAANQRQPARSQ